jgi:hypothetical protein
MKVLNGISGVGVRRSFFIGGLVAAGLVLVLLWLGRDGGFALPQLSQLGMQTRGTPPAKTAPEAPTPAATSPPPSQSTPPQPTSPSFDVVRINPQGDAIIAGRSAPNADISVRDGETEIGHTRADSHGEWVVIPDKPLPPGKHDLSVAARGSGDGETVTSQDKVTFDVPEPKRAQPEVAAAGAPSPSAPGGERPTTATVQRGATLWGIARDSYGSGTRFTTIYSANRDRINNPDRIYPGQVVRLPAEK